MPTETPTRPQRDDIDLEEAGVVRMIAPGPELRAASDGTDAGGDAMPTLFGHFARFNEWTEINSYFEGRFLERLAPGAFKKTIRDRGDKIRCLFQHGRDYVIGDKPLGPFDALREDSEGVYYEVPLLDTGYVRELVPGLEAGLYGASFRMQVIREDVNTEPGESDYNPDGIPERTIKEVRLFEGGPVTFPAYDGATAAVRSLTDHFVFDALTRDPERLRELVAFAERAEQRRGETRDDAPAGEDRAAIDESVVEQRDTTTSTAETQDGAEATPHAENAPSTDGAGTESHPERERRGNRTRPRKAGLTRRSSEPWRLSR